MKILIIVPGNEERLKKVASAFKLHLQSASSRTDVDIVMLDALASPEAIERHDVIILGTPTVKNDIYWPLQVAIDAVMQKVPRDQIARKVATGFTVSDSLADSSRNLEGLLWVFTENNARVLEPLFLRAGDSGERDTERISEYIRGLKGVVI
ncbi:MAG: hypothetical protein JW839_18835 [Candidatus Lokiarchaeota archaeon]|nr:hypothetical protein [Candidatus Lokiarchaeota archaeon]